MHLRLPIGADDTMPSASPRQTPRIDDSLYPGVINANTLRNLNTRLESIELLLLPLKSLDERLHAVESNVDFVVGVVRDRTHNEAFKLLADAGDEEEAEQGSFCGRCWACWPFGKTNFL